MTLIKEYKLTQLQDREIGKAKWNSWNVSKIKR